MKNRFDRWFSARSVSIAERTSRRAFLGRLGVALVGSAAVPLLPVARNGQAQAAGPAEGGGKKEGHGDYNNEKSCDYWAYCSLDAWMCHCCGGSSSSCPPGAQMSPITWVGTCKNPNDDKSYIVSYNDCCGRSTCGRCYCNRNEGDTERYLPQRNNLITWCFGVAPTYHCTIARVMSQA